MNLRLVAGHRIGGTVFSRRAQMKSLFVATASLMLISHQVANAQSRAPEAKISICIGPQTRDGFVDVDTGIIASIKDIQGEFRGSGKFTVVPAADKATLLLFVVGRRSPGQSGAVGVPIGTTTMFLPIKRRAIDTILRVGSYEKALTSEDDNNDLWRAAAKQVVKDVTVWVDANRSSLPVILR